MKSVIFLTVFGIYFFSIISSSATQSLEKASEDSSFELACRHQAKEIATETYKNCVTENRQSQVEDIRKEYQQKLSDLKSHYDGELKKISSGQNRRSEKKMASSEVKKNKVLKRVSGARELPEKIVESTLAESPEIIELPVE